MCSCLIQFNPVARHLQPLFGRPPALPSNMCIRHISVKPNEIDWIWQEYKTIPALNDIPYNKFICLLTLICNQSNWNTRYFILYPYGGLVHIYYKLYDATSRIKRIKVCSRYSYKLSEWMNEFYTYTLILYLIYRDRRNASFVIL